MNVDPEILRPHLALIALELSRLGGVIATSPIPWAQAPARVRTGLLIALLAAVHDQGESPVVALESAGWAATNMFSEAMVGICIGMTVRLSIAAAEIAGNAIATPMGFGAAQAFDPTTGSTDSALARLFRQLAMLLALSVGIHRIMIGVLLSSFRALPVGTTAHLEATFPVLLDFSSHVLVVGVQLALPLLSVLFMANVALGFIARAAPTMQIFNVGFAVLLATGGAVLVLSTPEFGHEMVEEMERNVRYLEALMFALMP